MGFLQPINFQELYNASNNPIRISCMVESASNYTQEMAKNLFGTAKPTMFDMRATCPCRRYDGNFYIGVVCENCGHTLSSIFCRDIEYKGWIVLPTMFPKLISPLFFVQVTSILNYLPKEMKKYRGKTVTIVDWLLDPALPIKEFWPEMNNGMTYLTENWHKVINFLISIQPKKKREFIIPDLMEMLATYDDCVFMDKIPVINELLHLMTQTNENSTRFQVDESSPLLFEIYSLLCSLCEYEQMRKKITTKLVDKRYMKIQLKLNQYAESLLTEKIAKKNGLLRKSVISGRLHFTARAVIIPLTDDNFGDEFYMPWETMCVLFKSFIVSYLVRRLNYSINDALRMSYELTYNENHPIGVMIFDELLLGYNTHYNLKGIPCDGNRNPSTRHGNVWMAFIVAVVEGKVIHISTMTIYAPNADFDGDHINVILIKEVGRLHRYANLHPVLQLPSKSEPRISNDVRLPDPALTSGTIWTMEGADGYYQTHNDVQQPSKSGYVYR